MGGISAAVKSLETGLSRAEVIAKLGQPSSQNSRSGGNVDFTYYTPGDNASQILIQFKADRLVQVNAHDDKAGKLTSFGE